MSLERPHRSLTARTLDLLREAIVHAEFAPGQRLRIDQLGQRFQVSIGAVREALSSLSAEGLVIAEPQKGFVVAPISRRDLLQLTEVRVEIEARCLVEAIAHGDLEWEARILSARHRLNGLGRAYADPGSALARQWHVLHEAFHSELASGCPNAWWLRLRQTLYVQSERYRRLSGPVEAAGRDIVAEHDAIAQAVLDRDAAAARAAIAAHLTGTTAIILASGLRFADDAATPVPAA